MTSSFIREHELTELLHDLDAIAIIIAEICDTDPRRLPYDDLNWAVRVIDKAASFVRQSIEEGVEVMTVTVQKLRGNARRLDKLNLRTTSVLAAMKRGEALLMEFKWYGRVWCLSGGRSVDDAVAQIVIKNRGVADVGDQLPIAGAKPQTWRWVGD